MLNQDFRQVLVAASGSILTTGTTKDLVYGQIGIFDADTYQAVTAPTYLKNKGILIALGTPDLGDMPKGAGIPNETNKSKTILGKRIIDFRGKKAKRGQGMKVAIGYDGIDASKAFTARAGDVKHLYVKLTGKPIENLIPGGTIRHYEYQMPLVDGCTTDDCAQADSVAIADDLLAQIKNDVIIAGIKMEKFVKVSKVSDYTTPPTGATLVVFDSFKLTITDDGSESALAKVQEQYPQKVTRVARVGLSSTYRITVVDGATPAAWSNAATTVIRNCATCPSGYTATAVTKVFQLVIPSGFTTTTVTSITGYVSRQLLTVDNGNDIIEVHFTQATSAATALASLNALTGATAIYVGEARDICTLTTPSTTAWVADGGCNKAQKTYTITLSDDVCGTSLLAPLKAIYEPVYGTGTLVETTVDSDHCLRKYTLTITGDCVETGCTEIGWTYTDPVAYNGINWIPTPAPSNGVGPKGGLLFESAFVNREEDKFTYDIFPYESDGVHIELSNYNPDWHGTPAENYWPVTVLQQFEYPAGHGSVVRRAEELSNGYKLKGYSRLIPERYARQDDLIADPSKYYDQYSIRFQFSYSVLGFSEIYTDTYQLDVFFVEGTGQAFEKAINSYLVSSGVFVDPVVL